MWVVHAHWGVAVDWLRSTPLAPVPKFAMHSTTWCVVALSLLHAATALPTRHFCATFPNATSGGASGRLAMRLTDTAASYGLSMDFTTFDGCDPTTMAMPWHVHALWNSASDVGVGGTACGSAIAGGHYDPTLQCTSASQFAGGDCAALGRSSATYNCTPALFSAGYFGQCEVGDLSGKFGTITTTTVDGFWTDVRPPCAVDFGSQWQSLVFHCGGSPRVLCGRMIEVASWDACTGMPFPGGAAGTPVAAAGMAAAALLLVLLL